MQNVKRLSSVFRLYRCFQRHNLNFPFIKKRNIGLQHYGSTRSNYARPFYECALLSFTWAGLLKFLGLSEEKESELVQILKKAETNIALQDYEKAEQMLHLALRISQQLQNEKGVTWVYSRLANVAFESGDYKKARTLFVEVMKRVVDDGMDPEDLAMIHMSFKLAKILEYMKNYQDAEMGYQFCLQGLQKHLREENPEFQNAEELLLMVLNGYAYFLHQISRFDDAYNIFRQAYDMSVRVNGKYHEKTLLMLNNLGTVCKRRGNVEEALKYFHEAEALGEKYPELHYNAWIHLNLGFTYMEMQLYNKAMFHCNRAYLKSSESQDKSASKAAEKCVSELKKLLHKPVK